MSQLYNEKVINGQFLFVMFKAFVLLFLVKNKT